MPEKFFQWIRSSDMTYVKLLINEAALHDFVDKIGTCNSIQFTDVCFLPSLSFSSTTKRRCPRDAMSATSAVVMRCSAVSSTSRANFPDMD